MKHFLPILLILFTSCLHRGKEIKFERGVVVEIQHSEDEILPEIGMALDGNIGVHPDYEEGEAIVVFKCEHNSVFSINDQKVHAKVKRGDTVIISYYELINGHGGIQGFDFIDANKVK